MSWLASLWVVLSKELREGLRDRKALVTALFFPALGPILVIVMLFLVSDSSRQAEEKGVEIPVAGRENAPHLVEALEQGARVVPAPADPEAAVRRGDVPVVIVIPPDFGDKLRAGQPAPVRIVLDDSRHQARPAAVTAERLLGAWSHQVAAQRLIVRGIHPSVIEPLAVEREDVSTPASRAAMLLATIPFFLVMAMFTGGMPIAIDVTAGERERQSLEPLFAAPVPRSAMVLAKVGAAALFGAATLAETLVGFGIVPLAVPSTRIGFSVQLDPKLLLTTFLLCLPIVLLAGALMVVFAARARSFRAAQTSLSLLMLVPSLPGMALAFQSARPSAGLYAVPFLGQQMIVNELVRGMPLVPSQAFLATGASLVAALVVCAVAVRTFERGQPLFDA
ncbi:MAG TPA: ABC transporter permease subunit [Anaeromyxobacteraceae bacterium]|nr:ABC transporter permease subunit [Anaeromyxobacteraceae bacterium]